MAKRRPTDTPAARGQAPGGEVPIRELDRVRLLAAVVGDDGRSVPAGSTGTVVGIYAGGEAFEVEFTRPIDALATVDRAVVALVDRGVV